MLSRIVVPVVACIVLAAGCGGGSSEPASDTSVADSDVAVLLANSAGDVVAAEAASCPSFPSYSEGFAYLRNAPERSDVIEGLGGQPLVVRLTLVEAGTCVRLDDHQVEMWGADPQGRYSAVRDQFQPTSQVDESERWLRGRQTTNRDGVVEFTTLFPGWEPGEPPHLTFTTPIDDEQSFTWRIAFDDAVAASVYEQGSYRANGPHEVRSIDASERSSIVAPVRTGAGMFVDVAIAVDPSEYRLSPIAADSEEMRSGDDPAVFLPQFDQLPAEERATFEQSAFDLGLSPLELYARIGDVEPGNQEDLDMLSEAVGVSVDDLVETFPFLAG